MVFGTPLSGLVKMYHNLRELFWCVGFNKDVAEFVSKCPNCKQVKVKHQKSGGLLHEIQVPTLKWEQINMDFVVGSPWSKIQHYTLWVVVPRLTKFTHFIPVKSIYSAKDYVSIFIDEIVCVHVIPLCIISDLGAQFTSRYWSSFQEVFGTKVMLSTTFNPKMHGQAERTIQTLEDILRAFIIDFMGKYDKHLPLWSLCIIKIFISPYPWLRMKPCMVGGVGLLFDCLKLVSIFFLVQI